MPEGNGIHFRLGDCERRMALIEAEVRGLEIGALRRDVSHLGTEIARLAEIADKRFDSVNKKIDDEVKGLRRLLYGTFMSVIGGAIFVAITSGLHP